MQTFDRKSTSFKATNKPIVRPALHEKNEKEETTSLLCHMDFTALFTHFKCSKYFSKLIIPYCTTIVLKQHDYGRI